MLKEQYELHDVESLDERKNYTVMTFNCKTSLSERFGFLRWQDAENSRDQYKNFYRDRLFPLLTDRYLKKYGGSFPLSGRSMLLKL